MLTECAAAIKTSLFDTAPQMMQQRVRPNIKIIASQPVVLQYFVVRKSHRLI
eukprot:SAG11_NODE_587_length_8334_cov_94.063509_4_plen_52_part_00